MAEASIRVRLARRDDSAEIASMVDDFVQGHRAEKHPRSIDSLRDAYFGPEPLAQIIVAERDGRVVGMGQWVHYYDMFWGMRGGRAEWLYVRPDSRGIGVSAAILAMICERIRDTGGSFLYGQGDDQTSSLYARSAIAGPPIVEFHLSGEAFQSVADLAGLPPRQIVRELPGPELNREPAKPR